jgi:NitT/TauT family transport system substrate-binding protein
MAVAAMRRHPRRAGAVGAMLAVAAACAAGPSLAADRINVLVVNERSTLHYAAFAGRELGFYEAEGLEVTFLPSDTTVPYVAFLANGDADLVMLDAPQVFQAVNAKQPVAVVFEANQFAPESIGVMKDGGIASVTDLKGKKVGLASERDQVTTMVALGAVGLTMDDISTVVIGEAGPTIAKALKDGAVDAFAGAASNLAAIEAAGIPLRNITPSNVSDNPGNSFVMWAPRKDEIKDVVGRFLRAYAKAMHAGVIDTKMMAALCKKNVPEQWENIDVGLALLDFAVYRTNMVRTLKRGELQPDVWQRVQAPYIQLGEIPGPLDPATFLDESFTDTANDYRTMEVKAAIATWKEANKDILLP